MKHNKVSIMAWVVYVSFTFRHIILIGRVDGYQISRFIDYSLLSEFLIIYNTNYTMPKVTPPTSDLLSCNGLPVVWGTAIYVARIWPEDYRHAHDLTTMSVKSSSPITSWPLALRCSNSVLFSNCEGAQHGGLIGLPSCKVPNCANIAWRTAWFVGVLAACDE